MQAAAHKQLLANGAWDYPNQVGAMELNIPAIKGIGDSLIYLVDRYMATEARSTTWTSCRWKEEERHPAGAGLTYIDHPDP